MARAFSIPIGALIVSMSISAAEIELSSGERFEANVIRKGRKSVLIDRAGKRYEIPNAEILSIADKRPSLRQTFHMAGGEKITGEVAREDQTSVTVATSRGFEVLEKTQIASTDYHGRPDVPPLRYAVPSARWRAGAIASTGAFKTELVSNHPVSNSGGVFIEPAMLDWKGLSFGYQLYYSSAPGVGRYFLKPNAEIQFVEHIAYATFPWSLSKAQSLFISAGGGVADIKYHPHRGQAALAMLRAGWEMQLGAIFFRAAATGRSYFETGAPHTLTGLEIGAGYAF